MAEQQPQKKAYQTWTLALLLPFGLFALATWCVLLFPGLSVRAAEFCLLRAGAYDRACWVQEPPEILFMGSSSARHGIIPPVVSSLNRIKLEKIANLGFNAATPMQNWATYVRNQDKLQSAKIVYYTLDPWMLCGKYYKYSVLERILWNYSQWRHMQENHGVKDGYFLPWKNNIQATLSEPRCLEPQNRGYANLAPKPMEEMKPFSENIYNDLDLFGPSETQVRYLARLKNLVEQNGGVFILVLTPKHGDFLDLYAEKSLWEEKLIQQLNAQLGPVRVEGSLHGSRYKLRDADYYDQFHMTASGANIFTALEFHDLGRHEKKNKALIKPLLDYQRGSLDKRGQGAQDADTMVRLGVLYIYGGMKGQACIQFGRALDFSPDHAKAREYISRFCVPDKT